MGEYEFLQHFLWDIPDSFNNLVPVKEGLGSAVPTTEISTVSFSGELLLPNGKHLTFLCFTAIPRSLLLLDDFAESSQFVCGESLIARTAWKQARDEARKNGLPPRAVLRVTISAAYDAGARNDVLACIAVDLADVQGLSVCETVYRTVEYIGKKMDYELALEQIEKQVVERYPAYTTYTEY